MTQSMITLLYLDTVPSLVSEKDGVWGEISTMMLKLSLDAEEQNSYPFMMGVYGPSKWLRCAQQCVMCAAPIGQLLHWKSKLCSASKLCVTAEGILSNWGSETCEPRFVLKEILAALLPLRALLCQVHQHPKLVYESNS